MARSGGELKTLARSERWIAMDRPSGVPLAEVAAFAADSAGAGDEASVAARFLPVHRVELEGSGLVLLALDSAFRDDFRTQRAGDHAKFFWDVLVTGYMLEEQGEIVAPLYFDKRTNRVEAVRQRGETATTRYRIIERLPGHTLLECEPVEDRPQQIRAHLASLGFPVAGDAMYGSGEPLRLSDFKRNYRPSTRREELPLLNRLGMHARRVTFVDPESRETIALEAPHQKDFLATIRQLRKL
ncbi:MAG: pseudouridine synthase [Phycisphaerae bacterium]